MSSTHYTLTIKVVGWMDGRDRERSRKSLAVVPWFFFTVEIYSRSVNPWFKRRWQLAKIRCNFALSRFLYWITYDMNFAFWFCFALNLFLWIHLLQSMNLRRRYPWLYLILCFLTRSVLHDDFALLSTPPFLLIMTLNQKETDAQQQFWVLCSSILFVVAIWFGRVCCLHTYPPCIRQKTPASFASTLRMAFLTFRLY